MQKLKQNPLMTQVFYNMLIERLRKIQRYLDSQRFDTKEITLGLIIIKQKLGIDDWHPFPAYQSLKEQLKLEEKVDFILMVFSKNSVPIDGEIKNLISLAHLLNFIHILSNPDYLREGSIKLSELFKFFPGYKEFFGDTNCQGQTSYSVKEKSEIQNSPLPENYSKAIKIINLLLNKGKLERVCGELFDSLLEEESEVSDLVQTEIRALFQDNLFDQAEANHFIKEVRSYKKEFLNNIKKFAVEEVSTSDSSPRQ